MQSRCQVVAELWEDQGPFDVRHAAICGTEMADVLETFFLVQAYDI